MHVYEHHMGHLYTSEYPLDYDVLYCEECGDSDWLIGEANTREEAWELLKDDVDTFDETMCRGCPHKDDYGYCNNECDNYWQNSGGWDRDYVLKFINANWSE